MIAPTSMYDAFPTLSPEEAGQMLTDAMIDKPKRKASRLGTFGEVLYSIHPETMDIVLNTAYNLFPDSKAAKGDKKELPEGGEGGEGRGDVNGGGRHGLPHAGRALLDHLRTRSATIVVGAWVWPRLTLGITEASTTRSDSSPSTRSSESTTLPRAQVPTGW